MTIRTDYLENYDRIAQDHVRYWRETGGNPFQGESVRLHNEATTLEMIRRHLQPGDVILDAGCGMGDLMLQLPGDVIGLDISTDYLKVAAERGLTVVLGVIEQLPWPDGTFDMVIATDILEHVLDLNTAVKELLRVLKRGGTLVVRTPNEEVLSLAVVPYEFVHLRRFDVATFQLLFTRIFRCEVLECEVAGQEINVAIRKP